MSFFGWRIGRRCAGIEGKEIGHFSYPTRFYTEIGDGEVVEESVDRVQNLHPLRRISTIISTTDTVDCTIGFRGIFA
jgi:hypothetical protein